ncbi:MAG TPA: hypothetical protein VGH49_02950, partial [Xanthobacteraceae bacterium]
MFIIMAVGLCGSLGWQLYSAWDLSRSTERASTLAHADKSVFTAIYNIRQQRTDLQTAFQAPDDFATAVRATQKKAQEAYDTGMGAVASVTGSDIDELRASIQNRWNVLVSRSRELEQTARDMKQRDASALDPWYKAATDVLDELAKLSLNLAGAVRMTDPAIAEYVETRQLAWSTRDTAGRECGTARPFVGSTKPLTPQARETITDLRGRTDATLAQLADVASRPGIAPELSKLVTEIRTMITKGKTEREAVYAKLDGGNKPVMAAAAWTEKCAGPMERIYDVAWISFDLMLGRVASVNAAASSRLAWIAVALAVSIAFCASGLML